MNVDYIVVGCGLGGINFCEQLIKNNKTFCVIDNHSQQSSTVAGGLYNPVTLKRFTPVWKSKEQLQLVNSIYTKIESRLGLKLDFKVPVYRRFTSLEEQNKWYTASDKVGLSEYLSTTIHKNKSKYIDAKFGFGEVLHTGRVDTKLLVSEYKNDLKSKRLLIEEAIDYDILSTKNGYLYYKNLIAKHIVFAEGFGLTNNPFFKHLPLQGAKGELITIYAPHLKLEFVLKASVFVIPIGSDLYRIGSTYEHKDKTNITTDKAKQELLNKLKTFINCDFKVVNQYAGIRPTVSDRKALVGSHKIFKNYHLLNGLGTRGVMIAPYVAKQLYDFIENQVNLDPVININRFDA